MTTYISSAFNQADITPDKAQYLIDALASLKPFQCSDYIADVKKILAVTKSDFATPAPSQVYGEDPAGDLTVTQNFKIGTIALGVARSPAGHGFNNTVNLDATKALLEENAKALVIPIYRNFLESHLTAVTGEKWDLLGLFNDPDFCESFATKVFNPTFINNTLCAKVGGALQYVQAIGYLFERARACLKKCDSSTPLAVPSCYSAVQQTVSDVSASSLGQNAIFIAVAMNNANMQSNKDQLQPLLDAASPFTWKCQDPLETPNFPDIGALWSALWISDDYATDVASTLIQQTSNHVTFEDSLSGYVQVEYGEDLWKWMKAQEPFYGNIFSVPVSQTNMEDQSDMSCFSAGTLIETATGSSEIQQLKTGDKILTKAEGEIGILSDERVVHSTAPQLSGRFERRPLLYGFNGEEPFVTAGHIFFTTAGPKAIKPSIALEENSYVNVGRLGKGDVLLKLKPDKSGYDHIEICSIVSGIARSSTVHGLHFAVGGGRYHANGYWVAENYPRLTMQSLVKRYNKLPSKGRVAFETQVSKLSPTFREVFGPCVFDQFKTVFGNPAKSGGKVKSLTLPSPTPSCGARELITSERRGKLSMRRITGQYHLINKAAIEQGKVAINPECPGFTEMVQKLNGSQPLPTIQVSEGKMLVDGQLAQHGEIHHSGIEWSHPVEGGSSEVYQHGILRPINEGTCLVGVVGNGPKNAQSVEDLQNIQTVSAFIAPNSYSLEASSTTYPTQKAAKAAILNPKEAWLTFWRVTIGFAIVDGVGTVQVALPDLDAEYSKQSHTTGTTLYTVNPPVSTASKFTVTITLNHLSMLKEVLDNWSNADVTPGPTFTSITLSRNPQTNAMHGDYDAPAPHGSGPGSPLIHAVVATDNGSSTVSVNSAMQSALRASPVLPSLMLAADVTNASSNVHQNPLPATTALSPLTLSAQALSPADLMNITVATPDDLQNLSQNYMTDTANFYRAPAEVEVFGSGRETEDAIPKNLKSGLSEAQTTFLGNYAKARIMQGLSFNDSYSKSFTKSDRNKMRYYFTGSAPKCLSQDPSFTSLTAATARAAFVAGNTLLQTYIDDSQNWGVMLFKHLTNDTILENTAVQTVSLGDVEINKYCMLLDVLDSNGLDLSMKYMRALRTKVGLQLSFGNIAVGSGFAADLQAIVAQIIDNVIANPQDEFYQLFAEDVQALQKEYSVTSGSAIAEQAFSAQAGIGLGLAWAITSMSTRPTRPNQAAPEPVPESDPQPGVISEGTGRCAKMFKAIKSKLTSPQGQKAIGFLKGLTTFGVATYAIFASIKYLMDWNDLSPASRAQAILTVVSSAAQIIGGVKNIAKIIQQIRTADLDTLAGQAVFIELSQRIGRNGPPVAVVEDGDNDDGGLGIKYLFPEEEYEAVDPGQGDMNVRIGRTVSDPRSAENITEKFGIIEKTSAVINVALNISTCICIGFQIKKDFESNQPPGVITLDILNEVANCAQLITGVGETVLMVFSVESAVIPVVGVVVAVLCIVINFIEMFVHHDPPEDPVQKYLDNEKDSFIAGLPDKPHPAFAYTVNPSQFSSSGPSTLTLSVKNTTDTTQSNTTVNSLFFQFSVGSVEANLLAAPILPDPATGGAPKDIITYAIISGSDDFLISAPPAPADGSSSITVKITSKNKAGSPIPVAGLTFTINGTGNGVAGVARIVINESANNRPDKEVLPSTDVQEVLELTKL